MVICWQSTCNRSDQQKKHQTVEDISTTGWNMFHTFTFIWFLSC